MPMRTSSFVLATVSVDAGSPPEFTRIWLRSARAPALSPVARRASARMRISSSLRMSGIDAEVLVQILKPFDDVALVAAPLEMGPERGVNAFTAIFAVNRSSGVTLSAFSCASAWNDMWEYRFVFVAAFSGFGVSRARAYV